MEARPVIMLRDYQLAAIEAIRQRIREGVRSVLLESPVGSGKTQIAAELIRGATARSSHTVFLARLRELLAQSSTRLRDIDVDHGVIAPGLGSFKPWLPVQVASVQTLARRLTSYDQVDLIVIDESHHFTKTSSYARILAAYPRAVIVGLTATPFRLDGRGLGDLFETKVVAAKPSELLDLGFLVPMTGFAYDVPDLSDVKTKRGDYDQAGLELVMGKRRICGSIVDNWMEHARGERTVVFAVNVAHSKQIVERFVAAGVAAEHVDGDMPVGEQIGRAHA